MSYRSLAVGSLLLASMLNTSPITTKAAEPAAEKTMNAPSVSLGYAILFVDDVAASLKFYEQAFGLERRFFSDENGMAYGELETGAACLAFANHALANLQLKR